MPKPPRSSVRLVRQREAARAAESARVQSSKDVRIDAQSQFLDGFDYVLRGVRSGETVDQALDLAATPADRRPRAFMEGANAARAMYSSVGDATGYARRAFAAYGLSVPDRDASTVARNLDNEVAWVIRTGHRQDRRVT